VRGQEADERSGDAAARQGDEPGRFFFTVPEQEHQTHSCQDDAGEEVRGQVLGEDRVEQAEVRVDGHQAHVVPSTEAGPEHRDANHEADDAAEQPVVVAPLRHAEESPELAQGFALERIYDVRAGQDVVRTGHVVLAFVWGELTGEATDGRSRCRSAGRTSRRPCPGRPRCT